MLKVKRIKGDGNAVKCPACGYEPETPHLMLCPRCFQQLPAAAGCTGCGRCGKGSR